MPNLTTPLRGLAALLRAAAGLLDGLAGGGQSEQSAPERPQPDVVRPTATAKRTPAASHETPKRRPTSKRPGRARTSAPKDLDDNTIAHKVETELFRDPTVPKGHVDVNVAGGVVYLRGEVKTPADVKRLEKQARSIPEVKGVENLLHLPGTPAPTRSDTPARQRKPAGRRTKPKSAQVHLTPDRLNAEVRVPGAEPAPNELARRRAGRKPAPLGSRDNGGDQPA